MAESDILFRLRAFSGTISSLLLPSQRNIDWSSRLNSGSLLEQQQRTAKSNLMFQTAKDNDDMIF